MSQLPRPFQMTAGSQAEWNLTNKREPNCPCLTRITKRVRPHSRPNNSKPATTVLTKYRRS
ncbi:MAG: hypothetical protein ACKOD8_09965 [Limnohabitans sp.]